MADFNIESLVNQVVEKLTGGNKTLLNNFKKDPLAVVKKLLKNIDLDNDVLGKIVELVKGKINLDELLSKAGNLKGIFGKIKGLFGK